jgi:hypothetical protein
MKDDGAGKENKNGWKWSRKEIRRMLKLYFQPIEPGSSFSLKLEELCQSMGAEDIFMENWQQDEGMPRRGYMIFSALPILGVAAYAVSKYVHRRRVVPMGV